MGHLSTAEILLRAGISRDARTKVDRTPLHVAAQEGHLEVVDLLLRNGADVEAKDMVGHGGFCVMLIFSCDQAALQMVFASVCPSVRPSVCLSHLFDYVPIIVSSWNFQELLPMTKVRSMQKVKVRGQRSRSQRSQPNLTVSGL